MAKLKKQKLVKTTTQVDQQVKTLFEDIVNLIKVKHLS
jgi:hypothetical protein